MSEVKETTVMENDTPKTAEELLVQMYLKLQLECESLRQQLNKRGAVLEKVCDEFTALKNVLQKYGTYDEHGESNTINCYCSYYDWQSDKTETKKDYNILKKYCRMSDSMKIRLEEEAKEAAAAAAKTSEKESEAI